MSSEQINVHVVFEHAQDFNPFGCSYIRLLQPLSHPSINHSINLTYGTEFKAADVVFVERLWRPDITINLAEILIGKIREHRCKFVYSLDDNLLDLPEINENQKNVIRFFAREADVALVTTSPLEERISRVARRVFLIGNFLDDRLFPGMPATIDGSSNPTDKVVLGYMGTFTHDRDFLMILEPLREILTKYSQQVELQILGAVANRAFLDLFKDMPVKEITVPDGHGKYPDFIRWMNTYIHWDIGLAPLIHSPLNECKSDLKYLDYSAQAIAGIYSEITPYAGTVEQLHNGILARDDAAAWVESMESLIENRALRVSMAESAKQKVWTTRMLKDNATKWLDLIHSL